MNFSSMEYFTILARERSFTKAAEQLHITQQSLSSHIAGLEKELGCQLLVRHIPLELTYAGDVFLRYADNFQDTQTAMLREFGDISQNQKGILRIGAAPTRGRVLLPRAIAAFQKIFPEIRVELTEGANDSLCRLLQQGKLDLAVADFPETLPKIQLQQLYREEIVLMIHRSLFEETYREKASECERQFRVGDFRALKECPFVLGSMEDIDGRIGYSVLKSSGIEQPKIRAVSHNVGMLLELCVQGAGACFCPEILVKSFLTEQQYREMMVFRLSDEASYWIKFGYRSESYQWSVINAFMSCAREGIDQSFQRTHSL